MSLMGTVYRLVGRRFSTLMLTAAGGAFVFDMTFNRMTSAYWDHRNKGKQWKDIRDSIVYTVESEQEEAPAAEEESIEAESVGGNGGENGGGEENGGSEEA